METQLHVYVYLSVTHNVPYHYEFKDGVNRVLEVTRAYSYDPM